MSLQEIDHVPVHRLIQSTATGIARAQYELDLTSIKIAQLMAGVDEACRVPFGKKSYSLLDLGFTPTFYQFVDTVIEIKVSISTTSSSTSTRCGPPWSSRRRRSSSVPRSAGKLPPLITTTLERVDKNRLQVIVTIVTAVGEKMVGVAVHFNVGRSRSRDLTAKLGGLGEGVDPGPLPRTKFFDGVVETDATGTPRACSISTPTSRSVSASRRSWTCSSRPRRS